MEDSLVSAGMGNMDRSQDDMRLGGRTNTTVKTVQQTTGCVR